MKIFRNCLVSNISWNRKSMENDDPFFQIEAKISHRIVFRKSYTALAADGYSIHQPSNIVQPTGCGVCVTGRLYCLQGLSSFAPRDISRTSPMTNGCIRAKHALSIP